MATTAEDNAAIIQKIENNFAAFKTIALSTAAGDKKSSIASFFNQDEMEGRMMMCPASPRTEFYGAYPGGLIQAALSTHKIMYDLDKVYGTELSPSSLIVTALFHDLGKIGSEKFDYFVEKDSDWHRKMGIMYDINPKLLGVSPSARSLWWLTDSGVKLTEEEFFAISSVKDRFDRDVTEAPTSGSTESMLTVILQQAIKVVSMRGKGKNSVINR